MRKFRVEAIESARFVAEVEADTLSEAQEKGWAKIAQVKLVNGQEFYSGDITVHDVSYHIETEEISDGFQSDRRSQLAEQQAEDAAGAAVQDGD